MPIYSFQCKKCAKIFDLLVGVSSEPTARKCPACGSSVLEQRLTTFAVGSSPCHYNEAHPESPCMQKGACSSCPGH